MANKEHLAIFNQGRKVWNPWKEEHHEIHPDLSGQDFSNLDLRGQLSAPANLSYTDFSHTNLSNADLFNANLYCTVFRNADLTGADLSGANLAGADLSGAILTGAKLGAVNLINADLSHATFAETNLEYACLVDARVEATTFRNCRVHGISAWNLEGKPSVQSHLIITKVKEPEIYIDNLEVAQFIYLLLYNRKIRDVIDTVTSKVVLILGRFTEQRKGVLDALRESLRSKDFVPVIFDFEKPSNRNFTETVSTLAHIARFVIADITDAKSIPQELQAIVPNLPALPVQPIILASQSEYGMFKDFFDHPSVLMPVRYKDVKDLLDSLEQKIIAPAVARSGEIMAKRQAIDAILK